MSPRRHRFAFCALLATMMVLARLALFDHLYFEVKAIPNHDMYQGAQFFATNMHSIRLSGDMAWWNPASQNGYAQYYQALLGPVAPTQGHITFFVWAQMIRLAALVNIAIPEYFQFLTVVYIVQPWLCFAALAFLCSLLMKRALSVWLVLILFNLSGAGILMGAWFFFQEHATLFFLLASVIAALQKTTPARILMVFAAVVIQAASANYWITYNAWFLAIVAISYGFAFPEQLLGAWRRMRQIASAKTPWTIAAGAATLLVAGLWGALLFDTVAANYDTYVRRRLAGQSNVYTIKDVKDRALPARLFVREMFDPRVSRGQTQREPLRTDVHEAHYCGAALVPLLATLLFFRPRRAEKWLILSAAAVLIVCLAPAGALEFWVVTPGGEKQAHIFQWYPHYLKLLLMLLAGLVVDRLLEVQLSATARKRLIWIYASTGVAGLAAASLGGLTWITTGLVIGTCLLLVGGVLRGGYRQPALVGIGVILSVDLASYFVHVSWRDLVFTASADRGFGATFPLAPNIESRMRETWLPPDNTAGFAGGIDRNMPVRNEFWPVNRFLARPEVAELGQISSDFADDVLLGAPLRLYALDSTARDTGALREFLATARRPGDYLLLTNDGPATPPAVAGPPLAVKPGWRRWSYNGFAFDVEAPHHGWLFAGQSWDKAWKVQIDGRPTEPIQANLMAMALPLSEGRHRIEMEFVPAARKLYWPAVWSTELLLLVFAVGAHYQRLRLAMPGRDAHKNG